MKIYEIGTGYTSIPARMGAATEIVVEELAKALIQNGENVTVLDIADAYRIPNRLPIKEVKVPGFLTGTDVALGVMHKLKRVLYSVSLALHLRKIINSEEDNLLLHFHNQYNMFFYLKLVPKRLRRKVKTAYTVHSYIWPKPWEEIENTIKKRYFQEVECVKNADYVLVLNQMTREHFVTKLDIPANRIHIVKNGVNTEVYYPKTEENNSEFRSSNVLKGKQFLFQVGSVCERKNQLEVIELLTEYLKSHRNIAYVYAGGVIDQEYQERIWRYAQSNDISEQVIYVGELAPGDNLNAFYSAAFATVFPSKLESFGMVIVESLSAGTPVIVKELPLFRIDSGIIQYNDKSGLENIVKSLAHCKNAAMDAREEIINQFGWKVIAEDLVKIWGGYEYGGKEA